MSDYAHDPYFVRKNNAIWAEVLMRREYRREYDTAVLMAIALISTPRTPLDTPDIRPPEGSFASLLTRASHPLRERRETKPL